MEEEVGKYALSIGITILVIVTIVIIITAIISLAKERKNSGYIKFQKIQGAGKMSNREDLKIDYLIKIITELQRLISCQEQLISKVEDINISIYRQTEVLKIIQKQTKNQTVEEQEEIKKKIEELNKMIKE